MVVKNVMVRCGKRKRTVLIMAVLRRISQGTRM
jgi:hypothetical protein